jgi:hypothetical protein
MTFYRSELELTIKNGRELDQYAVLAAWILSYLRQRFSDEDGAWPSRAGSFGREVRNTCEAVEALTLYRPDAYADQLVAEAVNWLINLPAKESDPDSRQKWAMHPTRFKALATVHAFDSPTIRTAFKRVLKEQPEDEGDDDIDATQYLKNCVLLDAIQRLSRTDQESLGTPRKMQYLIRTLKKRLTLWSTEQRKLNVRDLSYTIALLVNARQVRLLDPEIERAVESLNDSVDESSSREREDSTRFLYAALQLAAHFRGRGNTDQVLRRYLNGLLFQYLQEDLWREKEIFDHAVLLRILQAYYLNRFEEFRLRILSTMIKRGEIADQAALETTNAELAAVVHSRVEVVIDEKDELSGGYTRDHLFRVGFSFGMHIGADDNDPNHSFRKSSVVIKRSTEDAFTQAVVNYARLTDTARPLFARHSPTPHVIKDGQALSYFLVLEDLANHVTLSDLFRNRIDQAELGSKARILLDHSVENISRAHFQLFESAMLPSDSFPGVQLSRLYFSRIEERLTQAYMPALEVDLVPWNSKTGIDTQGYDPGFVGLKYCLATLQSAGDKLQPAMLGLIHGDLHSRNVMLDKEARVVRFIDMDKLRWSGDYAADLGLLLMDISMYRRIMERERDYSVSGRNIRDDIGLKIADGISIPQLRYPSISRATKLFQERLIEQMSYWAYLHNDATWQERLWLAVATALLERIRYQTESKLAQLLYCEGIRLLHELTLHVQSGVLLPCIPFRYRDSQSGNFEAVTGLPTWCRDDSSIQRIHAALSTLSCGTRFVGSSLEYYVELEGAPSLLLATLAPNPHDGVGPTYHSGRLCLPISRETVANAGLNERDYQDVEAVSPDLGEKELCTVIFCDLDTNVDAVIKAIHKAFDRLLGHPGATSTGA